MTRHEKFIRKGFFARAIENLVKLDKGCSFTLLGAHSCAIGDSLLRHWGRTLTPMGIHSSCSPVFLSSIPNDSFVIRPMTLRSDFDGLYAVK